MASKALERYMKKRYMKTVKGILEEFAYSSREDVAEGTYPIDPTPGQAAAALQAAALTLARELGLAAIGEPMTSHLDHAFTLSQQSDLRTDREQEIFGRGYVIITRTISSVPPSPS